MNWPDVPRACFTEDGPGDVIANVAWVLRATETGNRAYVEGYRRAAESFFKYATEVQRMSPEYIVFPLAFLWRHHIELALKNIIARGRYLESEREQGFPPTHKLMDLWSVAKPYIVVHGDPDAPELDNVEANIREFEKIDPTATGFRYMLDRSQTAIGLVDPPASINLTSLQEAMLAISNFFDGVDSCQQAAVDALCVDAADYG